MEKQIAWMRREDYDPSKPLPSDLVASKPVPTATASVSGSSKSATINPKGSGDAGADSFLDDVDDGHMPLDADEEVVAYFLLAQVFPLLFLCLLILLTCSHWMVRQ